MSQRYRTCQNCGASLTAGQTYCPRCGAPYIEPIIQRPGEFEPFPPEQPGASSPARPYGAQQPVIPAPPQPGTPYPPQGQGYTQPPYRYGQQEEMAAGQAGGSPEPPASQNGQGFRTSLIIGIVFLLLVLLGGVAGLFYFLGQQNSSTPGTTPTSTPTPTPTATPTATPTPTPTPSPTPTPGITPTTTPTAGTTSTTPSGPASFRVLVRANNDV
jgi:zinc-ribbon domain